MKRKRTQAGRKRAAEEAVGIIRVSKSAEAGQYSIAVQRDYIEKMAARDGRILRRVFEFTKVSGYDLQYTAEFGECMEFISANKIKTIYADEFMRILRCESPRDLDVVRRLSDAGVKIITADGPKYEALVRAIASGLSPSDIAAILIIGTAKDGGQ
jgi:Resolvase, N terminal domain